MRYFFLFFVFIFFLISGCSSNSTISKHADLNKYNYVVLPYVMSYSGNAELMALEVKIYDSLASTRLNVIGDKEISALTETEKKQLLEARFSASQDSDYTKISVNFVDYSTGLPIASCYGAYGLGIDKASDLEGAVNKVTKEISQLF